MLSGRWKVKPPVGTEIDWSHPLAQGLIAAYVCNENGGVNLFDATGLQQPIVYPGSDSPWSSYYDGTAFNPPTVQFTSQSGYPFAYQNEFTVAVDSIDKDTSGYGGIFAFYHSSGSAAARTEWFGDPNILHLRSSFPAVDCTALCPQPNRLRYVFLCGISTFEIWGNGRLISSTVGYGGTGADPGYSPSTIRLGYSATVASKPIVNYFYIWKRILKPQEIVNVTWDPWQLFQPSQGLWWYPGAAVAAARGRRTLYARTGSRGVA